MGKDRPFRLYIWVGHTRTFLGNSRITNQEAFTPLVQGGFGGYLRLKNFSQIGITVQVIDSGLGELSGSEITENCAGADPGPNTAVFLLTGTQRSKSRDQSHKMGTRGAIFSCAMKIPF